MQMTTEARAWLDATVRRILARHPLGDAERAGVTYELMSHLHSVAEARARAAGRAEVALEDLQAAVAAAGGEERLAEAFVQPLAKPLERVLLGRRLAAFAIDALLLGVGLTFLHGLLTLLLHPLAGAIPAASGEFGLQWLLPWGFHDPMMPLPLQAVIAAASAALVLGYFTWFEMREGRTLGKRVLELRVMRADGAPMSCRSSALRNLAKLFPLLLVLDTAIMLLAFGSERQRLSDRIAGTIVVRA